MLPDCDFCLGLGPSPLKKCYIVRQLGTPSNIYHFSGDPQLKSLIQLMAAAENGRDLLYFTFGDEELRDQIFDMHCLLIDHSITIGTLYQVSVLPFLLF